MQILSERIQNFLFVISLNYKCFLKYIKCLPCTLLKCYEQYSGRKGECMAIGGGTYAHRLKNGVGLGCAVNTNLTRRYGRAKGKARVNDSTPLNHFQSYNDCVFCEA